MEKEKEIKLVYYAHPKSHYNTELEDDCMDFIYQVFGAFGELNPDIDIELFNPNQPMTQRVYRQRRSEDPDNAFDFFRRLAIASDYIVMTSFLDGAIGAGVAEEGIQAEQAGKRVFLLSFTDLHGHIIKCIRQITTFEGLNILSIEETVERINNGIQ